jgi:hypothetical protein
MFRVVLVAAALEGLLSAVALSAPETVRIAAERVEVRRSPALRPRS